jgi:hypothetical protein
MRPSSRFAESGSCHHRFAAEWEAHASLRLRHGDVSALDDYDEHGRIHEARTAADGRRQVVARWWKHRCDGSDVVMLAATDVAALDDRRLRDPEARSARGRAGRR